VSPKVYGQPKYMLGVNDARLQVSRGPLLRLSGLASGLCLIARIATCPVEPGAKVPSAGEILSRVAAAYGDCQSYRDRGVVRVTFIQADGRRWTELKPFTTAFRRPDRFRFEFLEGPSDDARRYIVWAQSGAVHTWRDVRPGVSSEPSLGLALAGATGVSGGSAHTIPALLLPQAVDGWRLTDLSDVTRLEDAMLGGRSCIRVQGRKLKNPSTVWIDRETFLVRQIDEANTFPDFRTEQTTTYTPEFGEVGDDMLAFEPPVQK
jgi:hypothetical protein